MRSGGRAPREQLGRGVRISTRFHGRQKHRGHRTWGLRGVLHRRGQPAVEAHALQRRHRRRPLVREGQQPERDPPLVLFRSDWRQDVLPLLELRTPRAPAPPRGSLRPPGRPRRRSSSRGTPAPQRPRRRRRGGRPERAVPPAPPRCRSPSCTRRRYAAASRSWRKTTTLPESSAAPPPGAHRAGAAVASLLLAHRRQQSSVWDSTPLCRRGTRSPSCVLRVTGRG